MKINGTAAKHIKKYCYIVGLLSFLLAFFVCSQMIRYQEKEKKAVGTYMAQSTIRRVKEKLDNYITISDLLGNYIIDGSDMDENTFSELAEKIPNEDGVVKAFELAPEGIIINQILEIARIESGTTTLQLKAEDINTVFHTVNTVFEEDIRKKNLQYSADLDVYHTFIFCDRVKLQEIMLNIISNAIKYTSDGHAVHVKIYEKDSEDPRKARFIFTCEDTGIGMSEEYLPHIFEEFSREHTTTENKVAGTGLGLPIVKSMIELMGGGIQVESTQGVGTKFTVDISFDMASESDVYRDQISEQPDVLEKLEGKRILLAEDNDLNAEIAIELLAEQKIITDRAEDGAECLDKLEKADSGYYDMILMDIQMPVMDGYDAAARIRRMKDEKKASIPIIAMTANAFAEDRQKAISMGMNDHVAKPIDMNVLLPMIAKYIR